MDGEPARPADASHHEGPATPPRRWGLVVLAAAALASSWNPIAAPFGLVVGLVTAVLAGLALRRREGRRRPALAALSLAVLAVVTSAVVLFVTAGGVGADLGGEPVVKGRSAAELDRVLSEAAGRTRERRERAAEELEPARRPAGAAPPAVPSAPPPSASRPPGNAPPPNR